MYNYYQPKRRFNLIGLISKVMIVLVIISIISIIIFSTYKFNFNDTKYTVTVTDKQVKKYNNSDKYIIYTKLQDGSVRVFEDTDSMLRGKYNSSDIYAELEVGKKYIIKVFGYRNGFMSWYENILSVQPAE